MIQIALDLDTELLERYYRNNSCENAWKDIRKFLERHGYTKVGQTLYQNLGPEAEERLGMVLNSLGEEQPWLLYVLKNLKVWRIDAELDFRGYVEAGSKRVAPEGLLPQDPNEPRPAKRRKGRKKGPAAEDVQFADDLCRTCPLRTTLASQQRPLLSDGNSLDDLTMRA